MNRRLTQWYQALAVGGIDLKKLSMAMRGLPAFLRDLREYRRAVAKTGGLPIEWSTLFPITGERYDNAGVAQGHYFFQDLWAAQKIYRRQPPRHVDIGSSIGGFISHLLVFVDRVEVIDIRPLTSTVPNLAFVRDDATLLSGFQDNSIASLSSLHAGEHFGLGRYGDPIDPDGHSKFLRALTRVLQPNGRLYFSVPTGVERVVFNAHRVLQPVTVLRGCAGLELLSFSLIKDDGSFCRDASLDEAAKQVFGCGLYEFTKP